MPCPEGASHVSQFVIVIAAKVPQISTLLGGVTKLPGYQ